MTNVHSSRLLGCCTFTRPIVFRFSSSSRSSLNFPEIDGGNFPKEFLPSREVNDGNVHLIERLNWGFCLISPPNCVVGRNFHCFSSKMGKLLQQFCRRKKSQKHSKRKESLRFIFGRWNLRQMSVERFSRYAIFIFHAALLAKRATNRSCRQLKAWRGIFRNLRKFSRRLNN